MGDNLLNCIYINFMTCAINLLVMHIFCPAEYNMEITMFAIAILLLFYLFIYLLRFIFDQIDFSNDTPILDRYIRDYKTCLGCITYGSVFSFLVFSIFELDTLSLFWFYYLCSIVPAIFLEAMILSALEHWDLDRTRLSRVSFHMKGASLASIIFTLTLICIEIENNLPSKSSYPLQHVACLLANLPYFTEFYVVMTEPLNVRLVGNEDEVAMDNYQGIILDDFNSSDESEDEQLPNFRTKILINSEDLLCNICFLPFSDRRFPLMLTKCGHSLCKKCCKATQQQFPPSRFIICPFCRTQTPGPISELPKNYAIIGIVQKIGRGE